MSSDQPLLPLDTFQRWFLGHIQRPNRTDGQCDPAMALNDTPDILDIARVVKASRGLTTHARVRLYGEMYIWRLEEALRGNFRGLYALLGEADFRDMARDFLTHYPSQSFTLNDLGERLPTYFEQEGLARWGAARSPALRDMARLERAIDLCFRAKTGPILTPQALASVAEDAWGEVRFQMAAGFTVIALEHDANRVLNRLDQPPEEAFWQKDRAWVAVWRRGFEVWRQPLSEVMYAVLHALSNGHTMTEALEAGASVWGQDAQEALEDKLFSWFADWISEGFFAALLPP